MDGKWFSQGFVEYHKCRGAIPSAADPDKLNDKCTSHPEPRSFHEVPRCIPQTIPGHALNSVHTFAQYGILLLEFSDSLAPMPPHIVRRDVIDNRSKIIPVVVNYGLRRGQVRLSRIQDIFTCSRLFSLSIYDAGTPKNFASCS